MNIKRASLQITSNGEWRYVFDIYKIFLFSIFCLTTLFVLQDPDHVLTDEGSGIGMVDPTLQFT